DAGDGNLGIALRAPLLDLLPALLGWTPVRRVDRVPQHFLPSIIANHDVPMIAASVLVFPHEGWRNTLGWTQGALQRLGDAKPGVGALSRDSNSIGDLLSDRVANADSNEQAGSENTEGDRNQTASLRHHRNLASSYRERKQAPAAVFDFSNS